jgi:hypothetical protein
MASDDFEMFERKYFDSERPLDGHVRRGVKHFFSVVSETLRETVHHGMSFVASPMIAHKNAVSLFGRILEGITCETLKLPFAVVAVGLSDGVPVVFMSEKAHGLLGDTAALSDRPA